MAIKFNGQSFPYVDDAATFYVIKKEKKLDVDGSSVYLKIVLEENKENNLKIEWYLFINLVLMA
jgi:hypothetical protein